MGRRLLIYAVSVTLMILAVAFAQDGKVFFREEFNDLEHWKPLHFPKIKTHTEYSVQQSGDAGYLKAESKASASGIVFKEEFDVFEYPKVRWRWKVNNILEKGNAEKKSGDDYPIRIYIIFKYNPETASFGQKFKYGLVKAIYGEYPPHSSLNYIWANRRHDERIITNAYATEVKMIILQTGKENTGKWIDQQVDIIKDYHTAFDADPPAIGSLAIMSDSDNTGESATSYIDYIEVRR